MSRTDVRRSSTLRLTRRGRVVVVAALLCLVSASLLLGRAAAGEPPPPPRVVVVQPGDTLWEITRRLAPGEDPRPAILRIVEMNGLSDGAVRPGQRLLVPTAP